MQEPGPSWMEIYYGALTWLWIAGISAFGGAISYYKKLDKKEFKHSVFKLVGEIGTSVFVGNVTFALCDYAQFDWQLTIAMVSIASFKGTDALLKTADILNIIKREV